MDPLFVEHEYGRDHVYGRAENRQYQALIEIVTELGFVTAIAC